MKTARIAGLVLGMVLLAAGLADAKPYLNTVTLNAADTAATIQYFHKDATGATTTFANREEVKSWSVSNTAPATAAVIYIYTKAAPAYTGGVFGETFGEDYVTLVVLPGQSQTLEGVVMIGWWLSNTPTDGSVTILGWNK